MKTTIFNQGQPVTRLSHDKAGNVKLIHTFEAALPAVPIRKKTADQASGYRLPATERGHRNRRNRIARKARGIRP